MRDAGCVPRHAQHGPARQVEVAIEPDHHGLPGAGAGKLASHHGDACNPGAACADRVDHLLADGDAAGSDGPGKPAEVLPVADHELHREAESVVGPARAGRRLLQMLEECRAAIPGHVHRALRDVVAQHRRHWNCRGIVEAEAVGEPRKIRLDGAEGRLRPLHQVHLVNGQHHLPHAHQVEDGRMPPGLRFHA